jgi:cytochrome c biogenesis protein CcdA
MKKSDKLWIYSAGLTIMFFGASLLSSVFPEDMKRLGGVAFLIFGIFILLAALKENKK